MIVLSNGKKIDTTIYQILESLKFLLFISKFFSRIIYIYQMQNLSVVDICTFRRIAFLSKSSIVMRLISFFACILYMHGRLLIAVELNHNYPLILKGYLLSALLCLDCELIKKNILRNLF